MQVTSGDEMRITKQPSGGRGEYEICEHAPMGFGPAELLQTTIRLKLAGYLLDTGVRVTNAQGKYRLRLSDISDQHAHFQIAVALLLPKPVRDETITGSGEPILQNGSYIIKNINFGSVSYEEGNSFFVAEVLTIDAANQTVSARQIPVLQRMQEIERIWANRDILPARVSSLLGQHEQLVRSGQPLPKSSLRIVRELQARMEEYSTDLEITYAQTTDVLPSLLELINESGVPIPRSLGEIEPENIELRKREIKRWQVYARRRGVASLKFRRAVRDAYDCRCLMCSARFPSTSVNLHPGIDAAHILPWAEYDLDEVFNGIALCKLHHWAFDERLLQLTFRDGDYYIELSSEAESALFPPDFSIDVLKKSVGRIPRELLPSNRSQWPNAQLLQRLYTEVS